MKKYLKTAKYKNYNSSRSRNQLKRRLQFKDYKRKKNKRLLGTPRNKNPFGQYRPDKMEKEYVIRAPSDLSFTHNADEVVDFITDLQSKLEKRRKVFVKLQHVTNLGYGGIVVLLSVMTKFKARGIPFNGDFPSDIEQKKILEESEFLDRLYGLSRKGRDLYKYGSKSSIFTRARRDANSETSARIIEFSSKTIWGEKRRCPGVQRTLIELMQNTNNHANLKKKGEEYWWLSVDQVPEQQKVCFSFVDYGIGIFKSLDNKSTRSKFHGYKEKLSKFFSFENNADILKLICDGKLHQTVTGEHFRGKGIPGIVQAVDRNQIANLYIITNNVFGNISNNKYRLLNSNFSGTFVYWEIHKNNHNLEWPLN